MVVLFFCTILTINYQKEKHCASVRIAYNTKYRTKGIKKHRWSGKIRPKGRAGSVLNLLFLFIGGFMSNKEERMNRNKSIIEDYKNGKPILEIAREYNLSETMCYKILKGTQEPPRYFEKKRKRLTTRNEQIVKQYKGGMTARELGKMYGISMQRIYAILHSSGEYESQKYNHIETALKNIVWRRS